MRHLIWAGVCALAASACNERAPMGGENERATGPFLGAIPAAFENTLGVDEFRAAAGAESQRMAGALAALRVAQTAPGAPLTGGQGSPAALPTLDQCDALRAVNGGFLGPDDLAAAGKAPALTDLGGATCADLAARLDATFAAMAAALQTQTANAASLSLANDRCTSVVQAETKSERAAVGYEFLRLVGTDGLYLSSFNLPEFQAGLEGGGDGQVLALRATTDVTAKAQGEGDRSRTLTQSVEVATLVVPGEARVDSQKAELLDVRSRAGEQETGREALGRFTQVQLKYGAAPELTERTDYRYYKDAARDPARWVLTVNVTPAGEGTLAVNVAVEDEKGTATQQLTCASR